MEYDNRKLEYEIDCLADIADSPKYADDESYCDKIWDGFVCWNETKAGVTANNKCPTDLFQTPVFDDNAVATRVCDDNGTWKFYEERNKTWTNYTLCISDAKPVVTSPHDLPLQILYSVGYSLSLVALVVAITIFLYFRKLRCPRNTIHMHFFISFILRAIFVFIRDILQAHIAAMNLEKVNEQDPTPYGTPLCKMAFTCMQYILVANYYWLLVEGVHLHSLITLAIFSGRTGLRYYFVLGWGCPALIVLPWAIRNIAKNETGCWWDEVTTNPTYWIIKAPVMLSILVNFVLFLNITRVLATKLRASNAAEARVYRKLAKSTLVLIPIFGVYYIVTVGMHASTNPTVTIVRMYFDFIISPFQGLVMATLYCFLNGDVQVELKRKWKLHKLNRTLSMSRSVATRTHAHSRSSVSTPPRKDSNDGVLENGRASTYHRFSVIGRIIAFKSRLFHTTPRKGQMNGSVGNHKKGVTKRKELTELGTTTQIEDIATTEDDQVTEITRLKEANVHYNSENAKVDENKETLSVDEDKLLADGAPTNGTSEEPSSLSPGQCETDPKKGVHFAANIETEV